MSQSKLTRTITENHAYFCVMPHHVYLPIKKIRIDLHTTNPIKIDIFMEDQVSVGTKSFFTLQELANYLRDHPDIAKALGYIPKPKS